MEGSKTLFCSSKFSQVRERISSKFIGSLGTRPQKICQPSYRVLEKNRCLRFVSRHFGELSNFKIGPVGRPVSVLYERRTLFVDVKRSCEWDIG
jgi:hypothetical protein